MTKRVSNQPLDWIPCCIIFNVLIPTYIYVSFSIELQSRVYVEERSFALTFGIACTAKSFFLSITANQRVKSVSTILFWSGNYTFLKIN